MEKERLVDKGTVPTREAINHFMGKEGINRLSLFENMLQEKYDLTSLSSQARLASVGVYARGKFSGNLKVYLPPARQARKRYVQGANNDVKN